MTADEIRHNYDAAGRHLAAALESAREAEAAAHIMEAINAYERGLELAREALASIVGRPH
jgi:hypothetical protein